MNVDFIIGGFVGAVAVAVSPGAKRRVSRVEELSRSQLEVVLREAQLSSKQSQAERALEFRNKERNWPDSVEITVIREQRYTETTA